MSAIETRGLDEVGKRLRKLPFLTSLATTRAVNDTLIQAQTFTTQTLLPKKFTLRGRGKRWFEKGGKLGFNIKFAKANNPIGTLGSQADFLELQEHGGRKTAGAHRLAIPTEEYKPKPELMSRAKKPRAVRGSKAFVATMSGGFVGIFKRVGKERLPLKLLFSLTKYARLEPILGFERAAKDLADERFDDNFRRRFLEATK